MLPMGIGGWGVPPAQAQSDVYPWWDCSWEGSSGIVTYYVAGTFPDDVVREGVVNSFEDRISGAAANWNSQLSAVSANNTLAMTSNGLSADIYWTYRNISGPAVTTVTALGGCDNHGSGDSDITDVLVEVDRREEWWTQPDSRRSTFESCTSSNPSYTCSKEWDFGETAAHEMGHALGMDEAQTHSGGSSAADCGDGDIRATLCSGLMDWVTARRTPNTFDRETLDRVYENFD
ncbi:hypothetical protein [Euzebya sp.]|uniref:hypothetical protein n=2 Tax=Euzebya sp. TaxID=1971409 RepID=UPI003559764D